jgi:hypothetical protein
MDVKKLTAAFHNFVNAPKKGCEAADHIDLAQKKNQWRDLVNIAMNVQVPEFHKTSCLDQQLSDSPEFHSTS